MLRFARSVDGRLDRAINLLIRLRNLNRSTAFAKALAIPSHITPRERALLKELAAGRETIVEIGSYIGASAASMASASRPAGAKIYCIDTWQNDAMSEGKRDTFQEFQDNTALFSSLIVPIRGYSQDVVSSLSGKVSKIDLLFIDGDHSYEGAFSDWILYSSFLKSGSLVVFHDFGWAEGVKKVVKENVQPFATRSGRLPNLWWAEMGKLPC